MQPAIKRADSRTESRAAGFENEHPPSFYCPISVQCMHDPVVLCDGHSYERRHIERWLQDHETSPVSGLKLKQTCVFPNHALRNAIEEYFQKVFKSYRRAIRRNIRSQQSFGANGALLETMGEMMQCSLLVNADLSAESALRSIMDEAKILVGAEVASVFLLDYAKKQLYSTVNSTGSELRIPVSSGIAGHVATTGESVLVENAYSDNRFDRSVDNRTGFRTRTIICVPIKTQDGNILGVAQLINRTDKGILTTSNSSDASSLDKELPVFSMEDLHFLRVFAAQAATAIHNSASFETPSSESEVETKSNATTSAPLLPGLSPRKKSASMSLSPKAKKTARASFETSSCESESDVHTKTMSLVTVPQFVETSCTSPTSKMSASKRRSSKESSTSVLAEIRDQGFKSSVETKHEEVKADTDDNLQMLKEACSSWQMDAWAINSATGNKPLSTLACFLFEYHGLIEQFSINDGYLKNFFEQIEQGYDDGERIPYHNRVHATSVLHLTHMLLTHGGVGKLLKGDGKLEIMACLLAAAIHDHGHRGLNNNFLVKSIDDWALKYNDQHVNEHHHVASAFLILHRPEFNFLAQLPADEYRKLRSLVINLVLGTDMAQDKKIVTSFTKLIEAGVQSDVEGSANLKASAFGPASEEDVVVMLQMVLKCADVGHLTLKWSNHLLWVERLEEEFFAQGDKEKELSLEPSFLMDRQKPGVTQTQVGFFDYVALPLYQTLAKAFPSTEPMLVGVQANYQCWRDVETKKLDNAKRHTVA